MRRIQRTRAMAAALGGGAAVWSPTDITDLRVWVDFSDETTLFTDAGITPVTGDGDLIWQVNDKSGNGFHAVQAVAIKRPLYKVNIQNSLSAALFDNTDDYLRCVADVGDTQPITAFAVGKCGGTVAVYEFLLGGSTALDRNIKRRNTALYYVDGGVGLNVAALDTAWHILSALFSGAASTGWVDGVQGNTGNAAVEDPVGYTVGSDRSGGNVLNGYTGEILIYNADLSTADQDAVEEYLSAKWNIAI